MFIPRDPTTLSSIELLREINQIEIHMNELLWLKDKLEMIITDIDVVLPIYKSQPEPGALAASLETTAGGCMRALYKIERRERVMNDLKETALSFLKEKDESQWPEDPDAEVMDRLPSPEDDDYFEDMS